MAITDPGQLKYVAEAIRPAADRIIGSYDKALPLIVDWDDTLAADRPKLWDRIKPVAAAMWGFYGDARRVTDPWDWLLSPAFPDDSTPIEDGHPKPIQCLHVNRVMDVVIQLPLSFQNTSGAIGKAFFTVSNYTVEPADAVALTVVMDGIKALVSYLDDAGNANERRIRCRETSVNPNLFQ